MLYYGSKLSDHIVETPEGYLICLDTAINRTGSQTYLGSELQLDDRTGNERIEIVRDETDVFDKATLASFEGKPFCNEHPQEDVDSSNITFYNTGHAQNIRREGDKTIADIYVTDPKTIQDIKNGKREISCGYSCEFEPLGDGRYKQVNIRGNHIALVDSGRAGEQVRIIDSQAKDIEDFGYSPYFKQLLKEIKSSSNKMSYIDRLRNDLRANKLTSAEYDLLTEECIYDSKGKVLDKSSDVVNVEYTNEKDLFEQLTSKVSNFNGNGIDYADILDEIHNAMNDGRLDNRKGQQLMSKLRSRYEYLAQDKNEDKELTKVIEKVVPLKDTSVEDRELGEGAYYENYNKRELENEIKYLEEVLSNPKKARLRTASAKREMKRGIEEMKQMLKSGKVKDSSVNDDQSRGFTNALRTINRRDMTKQRFLENIEAMYQTRVITEDEYYELQRLAKNIKDSKGVKDMSYENELRRIKDYDYAKELRKIKDSNIKDAPPYREYVNKYIGRIPGVNFGGYSEGVTYEEMYKAIKDLPQKLENDLRTQNPEAVLRGLEDLTRYMDYDGWQNIPHSGIRKIYQDVLKLKLKAKDIVKRGRGLKDNNFLTKLKRILDVRSVRDEEVTLQKTQAFFKQYEPKLKGKLAKAKKLKEEGRQSECENVLKEIQRDIKMIENAVMKFIKKNARNEDKNYEFYYSFEPIEKYEIEFDRISNGKIGGLFQLSGY